MMTYEQVLGVDEARKMLARLQADGFRRYLAGRRQLLLPAAAALVAVSIACAVATAVFFAELNSWLALPALLLAIVVLLGSLYVQALAFFGWLESRALARALGHRPRGMAGPLPPVPWALAALVLFLPLGLLFSLSLELGLAVVALAALVPFLYTKLDRA